MRRVPTGIAALVLGSALLLACGNGDKGGDGGARDDRRDHRGKQRAYTLLDGRYTPIPEREGHIASIVVPGSLRVAACVKQRSPICTVSSVDLAAGSPLRR